jgi:hypothetical protein
MTRTHQLLSVLAPVMWLAGCTDDGTSDSNIVVPPIVDDRGGDDGGDGDDGGGGDDCGGDDCGDDGGGDDCGGDCGGLPPLELPDQSAELIIDVRGTGIYLGLDTGCGGLLVGGQFHARYHGEAAIEDGKVRLRSVDLTTGELTTERGCALDGITVSATTRVQITVAIAASAVNCGAFCALDASAEAIAACGIEDTPECIACRAEVEAEHRARCDDTCEGSAHRIVAEATLGLSHLAFLDDRGGLSTESMLALDLSLELDRVIDGDGGEVCP